MKKYTVNQIRSQKATTREKIDDHTIEKHIGDFDTIEEAQEAYKATKTGMETDKELILVDEEKLIFETILTTY